MIKLIRTNSESNDFQKLVVLLDQDLAIRDGDDHPFYAQFNKIDTINHVVVGYQNEIAVGCGAIKKYSDALIEIKRMFVLPTHRGHGVAGKVLNELEKWALELGYASSILETGKKQTEAIKLYSKCGYAITPNYGQYAGIETSVCMKKALK